MLAEFIGRARYEDLPMIERTRVKMRVSNALGSIFAAYGNGATQLVLELGRRNAAAGPSSLWLSGEKASVEDCAFANSALVQIPLLDDMSIHIGDVVIPAAFAVGEAEGRSGADIFNAIALGYELVLRLDSGQPSGESLGHGSSDRGFRHSWFACYGAAAAAV